MNGNAMKLSRGPYRVQIDCGLEWAGPLHIGTGERLSLITDAPILRDAEGKPYLPGSGPRGVLRDFCEREAPLIGISRYAVIRLFGPSTAEIQRESQQATTDSRVDRQGRLTVCDLALDGYSSQPAEVRDHVAIDRTTGAARRGGKFDQEVCLARTGTLTLIYEGDGPGDPELTLLKHAIEALREGVLAFGGKTGWGLGAVKRACVGWRVEDRRVDDSKDVTNLSQYLARRLAGQSPTTLPAEPSPPPSPASSAGEGEGEPVGPAVPAGEGQACPEQARSGQDSTRQPRLRQGRANGYRFEEPLPWSWLRLDLELQFDGPMLVAGPYRDDRNEQTRHDLRAATDAAFQTDPGGNIVLGGSSVRGPIQAHARRIAKTLDREPVANALFGSIKGGKNKEGARGLLRVDECELVGEPQMIWMDHVAIDRITGFAAEGKLFNTYALASPRFATTLWVRWHPAPSTEAAAVALLLFTLRDMQHGLLWVGSRTTLGYGHVKTIEIRRCTISEVIPVDQKNGEPVYRRETHPALENVAMTCLAKHPAIIKLLAEWHDVTGLPRPEATQEATHV